MRRLALVLAVLVALAACGPSGTSSPSGSPIASATSDGGSVVLVGRIVTMDDPAEVEAVFIEDGLVAAVSTRDEVLALAGDHVPVIDIGQNVAYPGFIDAHAHWIGDRDATACGPSS